MLLSRRWMMACFVACVARIFQVLIQVFLPVEAVADADLPPPDSSALQVRLQVGVRQASSTATNELVGPIRGLEFVVVTFGLRKSLWRCAGQEHCTEQRRIHAV